MNYKQIKMNGLAPDEEAYQVGSQRAAVRLTRASGAAASMFGFTACAFAIEADGTPTLTGALGSIEGWHTSSCPKGDLIVDGKLSDAKVAELKDMAVQGALNAMLGILGEEQAFAKLKI